MGLTMAGRRQVSAQVSMCSKAVTQSNGIVVRKSSIRKLPTIVKQ